MANMSRREVSGRVQDPLEWSGLRRCILGLQMEPEDMFNRFRKAIQDVNVFFATYKDELLGLMGTVAFGSGLHGWGFNIESFAKIYAVRMDIGKEKRMKRRWGDNFFDAKNVNVTYKDELMGDIQVRPEKSTVAFDSGLRGCKEKMMKRLWGDNLFTIHAVKMGVSKEKMMKRLWVMSHAVKMGVSKEKMMKRLWGDNLFKIHAVKMGVSQEKMMKRLGGEAKKKVWTNVMQPEGATAPLQRAVCQCIMGPLAQHMHAIMNDNNTKYEKMKMTLGITLKGPDWRAAAEAQNADLDQSGRLGWLRSAKSRTYMRA